MRLLHELRVTSYSCCTSYELLFAYESQVTIYCTSYELFFTYELRVSIYCTSYESFFTYELTSSRLFHEMRVTVYCTSCKLLFACELRLNFYTWFASYFSTTSYNKDKNDNKVMIKNYSLKSFCDKKLGVRWASFSCY